MKTAQHAGHDLSHEAHFRRCQISIVRHSRVQHHHGYGTAPWFQAHSICPARRAFRSWIKV